jgi:hypothetical protein
VLLAAVVLFPLGCSGPGSDEGEGGAPEEERAESVTLAEVLEDPYDYYGQTATLTGEVTQFLGPQAFEIGGESNDPEPGPGYGESADGLLVIVNVDEVSVGKIAVGQTVRVAGRLKEFDLREVEEELDEDLRGALLTYYASQPSLVATSIEAAGGGASSP